MALKFKQITKALFFVLSLVYPVVVFYFLVIRKIPLRQLSLFVIAFALLAFLVGTSKKKPLRTLGPPSLLFGLVCFS